MEILVSRMSSKHMKKEIENISIRGVFMEGVV